MTDIGDLNRFVHFKICFKFNKIDVFRVQDNEGTLYLGQFHQLPQKAAIRYFPADFAQLIFLIYGTFCQFSPTISYFFKKN